MWQLIAVGRHSMMFVGEAGESGTGARASTRHWPGRLGLEVCAVLELRLRRLAPCTCRSRDGEVQIAGNALCRM